MPKDIELSSVISAIAIGFIRKFDCLDKNTSRPGLYIPPHPPPQNEQNNTFDLFRNKMKEICWADVLFTGRE